MKKYITLTEFLPLIYSEEHGMKYIKDADGNVKIFKSRKAVESYCLKHKCLYVERKSIFYK